MTDLGRRAVDLIAGHDLPADSFGLVLLRPDATGEPEGFAYRGDWRCYPCSLVKVFHLVHVLAAIAAGRVREHADLTRAMADMITWSSNTGTNYVIDLITETTGDTLLEGAALAEWIGQREGLNRYFTALGWPEFAGCNITQKLMDDRRYGREAQYAGEDRSNLNALTPLATARLLWEMFHGNVGLDAEAAKRAREMLRRDAGSADAPNPQYQLSEYLGGDLPDGVTIHSKAGHNFWTGDPKASYFKHDMIRLERSGTAPVTMVLMTQGKRVAEDEPQLFPAIGRGLYDLVLGGR